MIAFAARIQPAHSQCRRTRCKKFAAQSANPSERADDFSENYEQRGRRAVCICELRFGTVLKGVSISSSLFTGSMRHSLAVATTSTPESPGVEHGADDAETARLAH